MDTKQMTTMIVGLVIAVVMVAGFMVPVINGAINDGSGDEGYVNTGSYYYKNVVEGETHTIVVTAPPDMDDEPPYYIGVTTVTLDGQVIATLSSAEKFTLPLFVPVDYPPVDAIDYVDRGGNWEYWSGDSATPLYGLICNLSCLLWPSGAREAPSGSEIDPNTGYGVDGTQGLSDIDNGASVEFQIDGSTVTMTEYDGGHTVKTTGTMQIKALITTDTTGDYVYAQSPIVTEDTNILFFDEKFKMNLRTESARGEGACSVYISHGTVDQLSDNMANLWYDRELSPFGTLGDPDFVGWYWDDSMETYEVLSVDTEDTADGLRLNKISLKETWDHDDPLPMYVDCEFDMFLVPTHVGGSGGSSGLSDTMIAMISVIPLITVIGIVIGAVSLLRRN